MRRSLPLTLTGNFFAQVRRSFTGTPKLASVVVVFAKRIEDHALVDSVTGKSFRFFILSQGTDPPTQALDPPIQAPDPPIQAPDPPIPAQDLPIQPPDQPI